MLEKYLKSQSLGRGFVRGRARARIRSRALNSNFMQGARALAELNWRSLYQAEG